MLLISSLIDRTRKVLAPIAPTHVYKLYLVVQGNTRIIKNYSSSFIYSCSTHQCIYVSYLLIDLLIFEIFVEKFEVRPEMWCLY